MNMQKQLIRLGCIIGIALLHGCGTATESSEPVYEPVKLEKEEAPKGVGYYCPMKCEGDKVYETDRNPCPDCDMKLIPTPEKAAKDAQKSDTSN
jgi:hypothetical protein